ncbi:protein cramped-like isoform X2 [Ahaetulla prasina]|uniref:protein cramped-like isoform X2 n=1 Tax=Ahaetulla prasina TaxID=499056 RepID=UPI002647BA89|nr:protein cramped-like isoform X2 [Ahaetulla prasina]
MNAPPSGARLASAPWMTVKLGDHSSGVGAPEEGLRKLGKRGAAGEEEGCPEGGGGGERGGCGAKKSEEEGTPRGDTNGGPSSGVPASPPASSSSSSGPPPPPPAAPGHDQHHFLRSSVRPQSKRLRKDPQASCVAAVGGMGGSGGSAAPAGKGKGADNGGTSSGNSSGIPSNTPAGNSKSSSRNLSTSTGEKEEGKKVRRQWESWSTEDKNTFFEGLYEHGKDFEAIQNNIALKYKKKSKPASMVKNKEQVRHFYYRTWHKISKYIDFDNVFSQGLKKSSLELYGLICYGELRKKIGGCMDDKNAAKLNELIQAGATTVRYKGRNLRIKAPMCRALKKLCDPDGISDEEDQKPVRLPLKVPVELQPRNNHAWARVQSLAQNPRLRMIVELHRKVSSLIEFLKQKWALHEVRIRKTLVERQLQDCRDAEASSSCSEEKTTLHLFPGESCTLTPLPGVARVVHSKAFCTVHWQESGRCKQSTKDIHLLPPAQILGIQSGQGTARGQVKYSRGAESKGVAKAETTVEATRTPQLILDPVANPEDCSSEAGLAEGAPLDLGVASHLNKPPAGLQDPSGSLEKSTPVTESREAAPAVTSPASVDTSSGAKCSCGDLLPDLEELSLLDPFPRYMKSCHDLIVPEKCLCTEKLDRKEVVALARSSPSGRGFPGGTETGNCSPTQQLASGRVDLPGVGPSTSETQAFRFSGLQAEPCVKELPDAVMEDSQEKLTASLPPPPPPPPPPPAQGQTAAKPLKDDPSHLAQQVREKGWSLRTSESLTLAEVYLMMGKPNKLQLEYDWLAVLGQETQDAGEPIAEPKSAPPSAAFHKQKLLNCLLKLISSEVNPKPIPEMNSVATSPIKPIQEEHALTPPGKVIAISTRSPGCARNQPALHKKTFSPSATPNSSGFRNPSKPLLVASSSCSSNPDADGGLFAIPTTLPPNSRHGKLFLQNKEADLSFRQRLDTISMQSDFFLPKPRKLRSRHLRKPLVVQRTLLPRPSENPSQHVCSFSILSNSSITGRGSFRPIQSSLTKAAVSRPIVPKILPAQATSRLSSAIDLAAKSAGIIPGSPLPLLGTEGLPSVSPLSPEAVSAVVGGQDSTVARQNGGSIATVAGSNHECQVPFLGLPSQPEQEAIPDGFQGTPVLSLPELPKTSLQNGLSSSPLPSSETSSTRLSPPNVSALLDISLPGPPEDVLSQGEPATQISDSIIEIAISSGQYGENVSLSPAKLNGSDNSKSLPSPSCSPQQSWIASPSHDPQWYPNDSTDSSLSSLFSSFLSPEKGRKMLPTSVGNPSSTSLLGPSLLDGNSRDSFVSRSMADVAEVVDSQLACMMNENSIDYISRFNDLAQELSIPEPTRREILFDGGSGGPPIGDLSQ